MRIRPGIIIAIIVLLALAASGQWFFFKSRFQDKLPELEAQAQAGGIQIDYDSVEIAGFPFRLEAHYRNLRISKSSPLLSFALEAPRAVLNRQLWREDLSLLYFAEPRFAAAAESPLPNDETGESTLIWQAKAMQSSVRSNGPGLTRVSNVIDQPQGQTDALAIGDFIADQLQFHLNWPQLAAPETLVNVALRFTNLQTQSESGTVIERGYIGFAIRGQAMQPLSAMGLMDWRASEGSVELTDLEIDWEKFQVVQGSGEFTLDPQLRVEGSGRVDILGLPALTHRLDKSDILEPELEDITLITLRLMLAGATSDTPVPVEFTLNNGLLRVGPSPLVKLGPFAELTP